MKSLKFSSIALLGLLSLAGCGGESSEDAQKVQTMKSNFRLNIKESEKATAKGNFSENPAYGVWEHIELIPTDTGEGYLLLKIEPDTVTLITVCSRPDGSSLVAKASAPAVITNETIDLAHSLFAVEMSQDKSWACQSILPEQSLTYSIKDKQLNISISNGLEILQLVQ